MARPETLAAIARDGVRHARDGVDEAQRAIGFIERQMSFTQDVLADASLDSAATLFETAARRIRMVQAERDRMRRDATASAEIQDALRVGAQVIQLHGREAGR